MKKILLPVVICLFFTRPLHAQHFIGDMTLVNGNTAVFTVKPCGGDITGLISVLEYYLRWNDAFGNGFTFSNIVNNNTDFPGMNIVTVNNDVPDSGFNNQHFAFVGLTTATKTYYQDSIYEVFRVNIGGAIPAAFQLVANNQTGVPYYFTVQGDSGVDYSPYSVSPFDNPTDSIGFFFYKTYMYSILSVGLASFNGTVSDCNAVLNWTTSAEMPGGHFEIQQSRDGANFFTVKSIPVSGSSSGHDYKAKVPMLPGENYFRLKIAGVNDREQYSNIIALRNNCNGIYIVEVIPNPVMDGIASLQVTVGEETSLDIRLTDMSGKLVQQYDRQAAAGVNKIQLPLPKITAGQYIITVYSPGSGKATQKIFVQ